MSCCSVEGEIAAEETWARIPKTLKRSNAPLTRSTQIPRCHASFNSTMRPLFDRPSESGRYNRFPNTTRLQEWKHNPTLEPLRYAPRQAIRKSLLLQRTTHFFFLEPRSMYHLPFVPALITTPASCLCPYYVFPLPYTASIGLYIRCRAFRSRSAYAQAQSKFRRPEYRNFLYSCQPKASRPEIDTLE